jgi:phage terminase small subunit
MARGGYRPNSGPVKGTKYKKKSDGGGKKTKKQEMKEIEDEAKVENLDPLTYMLKVMNDDKEPKERRDRMAVAAAPFCHPRKGDGLGKKEEKGERAKAAGAGRFAASKPPKLAVVGK